MHKLFCNNVGESRISSPALSTCPGLGCFAEKAYNLHENLKLKRGEKLSSFPRVPAPLGPHRSPYLEKVLVHDLQAAAVANTLARGADRARGHGPGRRRRGQRGRGGAGVLVPRSLGAHLKEAGRHSRGRF